MLARRNFLKGILAAPAIIRTPGLLMAIKPPVKISTLALKNYNYETYSEETLLEFDRALRDLWDLYKISPSTIIISAEEWEQKYG